MTKAVIEAKNVTKQFGGLTAVCNVDLAVRENSISSIIGPNGAGKTTLFNCVSGFYMPEEGEILFNNQRINGLPTHKICDLGISRTYQNIRLFREMTAIENILVGEHARLKTSWLEAILHNPRYIHEEKEAVRQAFELLDYIGLSGLGNTCP